MKRRIRRIRRALKRAGLYNAFHITLIAVLLTGFCVILFNVKEPEQQEEKPETTQAEVIQNPETMTCNCTEAVEYQKEKQRKEKAMMNVSALFGENAAPDKRCDEGIVNILKAAVEEIYTGGLAKVTLNLRGGGQSINFTECKG